MDLRQSPSKASPELRELDYGHQPYLNSFEVPFSPESEHEGEVKRSKGIEPATPARRTRGCMPCVRSSTLQV